MASTYTVNLGIEKIGTGEQSGTWGTTTNTNFDLIDQAINGAVTVTLASAGTSGVPNTLAITDGAVSDGRNKFIDFADGGDLGAAAYVQLTPNDAEKLVHIRNSLSGGRSIFVFQGTYNASNDFEIPNGKDVVLKFDGGGATATVTQVFEDLLVTAVAATTVDTTNIEVTNLKAKDGTSAGSIADSTGVVTLASSVLTTTDINGGSVDGVTLGTNSAVTEAQIDNININGNTISSTDTNGNVTITPDGTGSVAITKIDVAGGEIDGTAIGANSASTAVFTNLTASGTVSFSGATVSDGGTVTTVNIDGGSIDGTIIGAASPAAGTFTTVTGTGFASTGDMTFGDNDKAIFGAGSDFQIYHDGSNSYIEDAGTGVLFIKGTGGVYLRGKTTDEDLGRFLENGAVDLYYDGSSKLATTATGIDVTGTITADGLTVDNSGDIRLGFSYSRVADADNAGGFASGYNAYVDGTTVKHDSTGTLSAIHYYSTTGVNVFTDESAVAGTAAKKRALFSNNGDISFYEDTGTNARIVYDASAAFIVNEDGADFDFRVESDTNTHALFVDAGNSRVGINVSSPATDLDVGAGGVIRFRRTDNSRYGELYQDNDGTHLQSSSAGDNLYIDSTAGNIFLQAASGAVSGVVVNDDSTDHDFRVESDNNANMLFVDGGNDHISIGTNVDMGGLLNVKGRIAFEQPSENVDIYGINPTGWGYSVSTYGVLQLGQSGNNGGTVSIGYDPSVNANSSFTGNGSEMLFANGIDLVTPDSGDTLYYYQITMGDNGVIVNENSVAALDFRVESDSTTYALLVDAGGDFVAIGNNTKTPASNYADQHGFAVDAINGATQISSDSTPLEIGRTTTAGGSGTLIQFRAESNVVGYIGTDATELYIGNGDTTLKMDAANNGIFPRGTAGVQRDGAIQLGSAGNRFTDLYLSGGLPGTATGSLVINENGVDSDFRVESDTNANALFVDAGNSRVGINTTYINAGTLQVQANSNEQAITAKVATDVNSLFQGFNSSDALIFQVTGSGSFVSNTDSVFNENGADLDFRVESDNNTHALFVDAGNDRVTIGGRFAVDESGGSGITNYRTYQMVNGQATAAASNTWLDVVDVGVTAALTAKVIAVETTDKVGTWVGSVAVAYGGESSTVQDEVYIGGTITDIDVRYNNTASTIQINVTYTGAAPTIYWTIDGMNFGEMSNLA